MEEDLISLKEAQTLVELFRERVRRSPDRVAYREYDKDAQTWREHTWSDIAARVAEFQAALTRSGCRQGDRIALLLANGTDWVCFDLASLSLGLVTVPLYSTDSPANNAYMLGDSGARLLFVVSASRWDEISRYEVDLDGLEEVWIQENAATPTCDGDKIHVRRIADVVRPTTQEDESEPVKPDDLATLIYTSGTTGNPKGVMLTHAQLLWNAEAATEHVPPLPDDVFLSFLPLAHAFERTIGYYLPMIGGSTVAYARSIKTLQNDIELIRPTVLVSVPRIYERMYAAIQEQVRTSFLRRWLLETTIESGYALSEWREGRRSSPPVFRRLIFPILKRFVADRILSRFGGRLRVAVSGGAAMPREVERFLIGIGLPVMVGYGLSEAAPIVTARPLDENRPGSVGRPLTGSEVRITERGELTVRSPSVMRGYWRNPDATAQVLDADGWLKTGDLAEIRDGHVHITGRVKSIVVLASGENVNTAPIEATLVNDPLIEQACVLGDGKPFAAAILVLNEIEWARAAEEAGISNEDTESKIARTHVLKRVEKLLAEFPKPSQIHAVYLECSPWSVENGLLTPTLKVKRALIEKHYSEEMAMLYEGHAVYR